MPLYHGTRRGFTRGGLLLPGDEVDQDNHGLGRSERVYVTPDLDLAWAYAEAAAGRGAPKVLIVEPRTPLQRDDSTVNGEEQECYSTGWARVVRVLRTRAEEVT